MRHHVPADRALLLFDRCQVLQLLKFHKGQHHLAVSPAVLEQHERVKAKTRRRIDPSKLIWKPPSFTRQELRFGF